MDLQIISHSNFFEYRFLWGLWYIERRQNFVIQTVVCGRIFEVDSILKATREENDAQELLACYISYFLIFFPRQSLTIIFVRTGTKASVKAGTAAKAVLKGAGVRLHCI
jgi:hypothetical protein